MTSSQRAAAWIGVAVLALSPETWALSQRTFVKSTGVDNPSCSLANPCRTFAAALLATLDKGEIIVLDTAGYGSVTISQNVSIIAPRGVHAGIALGGVGILGNNLRVVLEGLTLIDGSGISVFGDGTSVYVNRCTIDGTGLFAAVSIGAPTAGANLYANDLEIRNAGYGIFLNAIGAHAVLNRLTLANNNAGIVIQAGATVSVRDSVISRGLTHGIGVSTALTVNLTVEDSTIMDNTGTGVAVQAAGGTATADIRRTTLARNLTNGASADTVTAGSHMTMTVAGSVLTGNGAGIEASGPGATVALANGNTMERNGPSALVALGPPAVIHTRSNNVGQQTAPTSGNVTPVAGF